MSSTEQLQRATVEWRNSNPLRVWRTKHDLAQTVVAGQLELSEHSVRMYELGSFSPSDVVMLNIAKLIGITLTKRWHEWMEVRPMLER